MVDTKNKNRAIRAERRSSALLWGGMFVGGAIAVIFLASQSGGNDDEVVQPVTLVDAEERPTSPSAAPSPAPAIEAVDDDPVVPERWMVKVVERHPHDAGAFTQGLLWHDGALYESTGQYGQSTLRVVDLKTGTVLDQQELDRTHFGEGLARVGDRLVQLTWKSGTALFWRLSDLETIKSVSYSGEGWGLCYNGTDLVMSNGSSTLTFRDPESFDARRQIKVVQGDRRVLFLNELECVGEDVYANVWHSEEILRIDSTTGQVTAVVDASGLLTAKERQGTDVLNGIAYVPKSKRFLLTGKRWPHVFEVEFERRP